jgi:hypothetical protein
VSAAEVEVAVRAYANQTALRLTGREWDDDAWNAGGRETWTRLYRQAKGKTAALGLTLDAVWEQGYRACLAREFGPRAALQEHLPGNPYLSAWSTEEESRG